MKIVLVFQSGSSAVIEIKGDGKLELFNGPDNDPVVASFPYTEPDAQ